MNNTNCLSGMQCPECRSEGPFWIEAKADFLVSDNGTEEHQYVEWRGHNGCECAACHHRGCVADFKTEKDSNQKPYSVLLLYPDTGHSPETYYDHTEAKDADAAIANVQAMAADVNPGMEPEDFLPLIVLPGHIEAELFYRDIAAW